NPFCVLVSYRDTCVPALSCVLVAERDRAGPHGGGVDPAFRPWRFSPLPERRRGGEDLGSLGTPQRLQRSKIFTDPRSLQIPRSLRMTVRRVSLGRGRH